MVAIMASPRQREQITELKRWKHAYEAGDEDAFYHLMGPEQLVDNLGELLGCFMIRKVATGQDLLRAAGSVTRSLAKWLLQQEWIDDAALAVAVARGGDAARDLPEADKLAGLLRAWPSGRPESTIVMPWPTRTGWRTTSRSSGENPALCGSPAASARSRCRSRPVRWPRRVGASTWCSPGCVEYGTWSMSATSTRSATRAHPHDSALPRAP